MTEDSDNHPSPLSYEQNKKVLEEKMFRFFLNTIRTIWESKYEIWCELTGLPPTESGFYNFLRLYSQVWEVVEMPCKGKKKGKK